jgi:hypothetical protein
MPARKNRPDKHKPIPIKEGDKVRIICEGLSYSFALKSHDIPSGTKGEVVTIANKGFWIRLEGYCKACQQMGHTPLVYVLFEEVVRDE